MSEFGADHDQISTEFLRRSREYLDADQLLQASEKGWGAAAHAAKLYSETRDGLEYERHEQLGDVVLDMSRGTNDFRQISKWATSANRLHRNFYDDSLNASAIEECLNEVTQFVNYARQLVGLPPIDG